jgi:hypothetical protein
VVELGEEDKDDKDDEDELEEEEVEGSSIRCRLDGGSEKEEEAERGSSGVDDFLFRFALSLASNALIKSRPCMYFSRIAK